MKSLIQKKAVLETAIVILALAGIGILAWYVSTEAWWNHIAQ